MVKVLLRNPCFGGSSMSRFLLSIPVLALVLCGCDDRTSSVSQLHHTTEAPPVVSVVPVIDNTKHSYEWNLSDELSSALYAQLSEQDHVRLINSSRVRAKTQPLLEKNNPFDTDISWVKKAFQDEEFVVFLELVEHEEVLKQNLKKVADPSVCAAELRMSMRVRVIDVRGKEPRIVLQELVHDNHAIHPQFNQANFYQVAWKDQSFSISPMGLAHAKFTKEIAKRIDDYILFALNK
jgi:hypothetical protein